MAMATEDGGVMTGVSAPLAVAAGVCGHEGREDVYCRRLTEALWCGNRDEATEIVEQFNVNLSRPSGAVVFRPFRPIRIAVGN